MLEFARFAANCKMRHEFDDMIHVRFQHNDGQTYDTWVSGEEVLRRIKSMTAEERLQALRRLDLRRLNELREELPEKARRRLRDELRERLGDAVEGTIGDDLIGGSLADAIRRDSEDEDSEQTAKASWTSLLHDTAFRSIVLELAWIQLEGSIPEGNDRTEADDWL